MTFDECTPGRPVWARVGSTGWRPARVFRLVRCRYVPGRPDSPLPGLVAVVFESGAGGAGKRRPTSLRPRDPALKGRDKPTPREAADIQAAEELIGRDPESLTPLENPS
jgi:hypothetical protein